MDDDAIDFLGDARLMNLVLEALKRPREAPKLRSEVEIIKDAIRALPPEGREEVAVYLDKLMKEDG